VLLSGDLAGASEGLASLAGHPDPWVRTAAQMFRGHLAIHDGDIDEAAAGLAAGRDGFEAIGDRWGLLVCLTGLAEVAMARGTPAEAVRLLEEARGYAVAGLAVNFGEMMSIPLAKARAQAGDPDAARAELERGVGIAGRIGEHDDEAAGYLELSEISRRAGDLAAAGEHLRRALEVVEPRSQRPDMIGVAASTYSKAGALAEQEGDLAGAARWHARALGVLSASEVGLLPINPALAGVVEGVAALAAARGETERAAELLGLARTLQGYANSASLESGRASAAMAGSADPARMAAAYARGRLLGRREALALTP